MHAFRRRPGWIVIAAAMLGAGPGAFGAAQTPAASRPPAARPAFDTVAASAASARESGRLEAAVGLYRKALALRPAWDEGRWYLGSSLYELERHAEAREAFAALVARQPAHAGAVGMQGLCEFALGRHEASLRTLLKARALGIARNREIAQVVAYHAGILLTRFEEFEVGYAVLTELSGDDVESPKVIDALGLNVLRMPILPDAIPADKKALVQLAGRAGFAMGGRRLADAGRLLDELVATFPKEPNVHYARGVLRTTEAPDRAIEDFVAELQVSPDHIPARLQLVFEHVKRGEAEQARPYAAEALRLAPSHFAVHLAMGQVWFETGDVAKAIAAFEHGAKLAPGSPQAQFLLARAYGRAGRTADAARARAEFQRLEKLRAPPGAATDAAPR